MQLGQGYRNDLGDYLRQLRIDSGFSQLEVATKLGYSSPQYISNIERGLCATSLKQLSTFQRLYKVSKVEFTEEVLKVYRGNLKDVL